MHYIYAIDLPEIVVASIESFEIGVRLSTDGAIQDSCQFVVRLWSNVAEFICIGKRQIDFDDYEVRVHQLSQGLSYIYKEQIKKWNAN